MKIMAGRREGRRNAGGRGNINFTAAELNALINERVDEALAARENNPPLHPTGGRNSAKLTNTLPLSCDNMAGGTICQLRYHPPYNITVLTSYQSILHCHDM
ncbi:hypothetical protein E3N88_09124 [Mikania micrantha]|uniref:Uncharacterized protein n=1 Tax=Mikania micrantha TaxID=192012 RepID=A0A5N6PJ45_9ASTR|nr:hypothetical protein E3N88_09124 [Mikania micrantha]